MNIKPRGKYVDAFVMPVKKSNLEDYLKLAKKCSKIWLEHGAIEYVECVGTNIFMDYGTPFPKLAKLKKRRSLCILLDCLQIDGKPKKCNEKSSRR